MNILISNLSLEVLYIISHHKSIKATWDALQTLYEGTEDVKDSNDLNTDITMMFGKLVEHENNMK